MNKIEKIILMDYETGEILTPEIYKSLQKDDFRKLCLKVEDYVKNPNKIYNSSDLHLKEEICIYAKYKKISEQLKGFDNYYQLNKSYLFDCIDSGMKKETLHILKDLADYTNTSYTITYKNNVPIRTDEKIAEILEISISCWKKHKQELLKYKIIKKINFNKEICYKMSPCVYGLKKKISIATYYAFRDELKKEKMLDPTICLAYDYELFLEFGIMGSL